MRSVYAKILMWCFATLMLSLLAFSMVSRFVETRAAGRGGPMGRIDALILREGAEAYESGGSAKLAAYLGKMNTALGDSRYLVDPAGRDLASGTGRADLLDLVHSRWSTPVPKDGHIVVVTASPDNRYLLITVLEPPFGRWTLIPYYALILAAVALVCWALGLSIASPLRELVRGVDRFGRGELTVRLNANRRDEIGELARSFNRMAERISTLLTAERRLLQDVSHELRSPLARMSFAVELARREEHREAALRRIKGEIDRLSSLVGTLLEVTRGEGDPLARKEEEFALADVLREIASDSWIEADASGCRVVVEAKANPVVCGDRELLRRAFENIVRNAIRYAPADSCVNVGIDVEGQQAQVSIRDHGAGVPEEFLTKLGQPFVRVDDSRDSSTGGVGLGLAIAKRAIAMHHGSLRLENAKPGLRVSIELPLSEAHVEQNRPSAADAPAESELPVKNS